MNEYKNVCESDKYREGLMTHMKAGGHRCNQSRGRAGSEVQGSLHGETVRVGDNRKREIIRWSWR